MVGQIVKLNTPLAILKHTLPPRTASPFNTSASSALRPPPTSSPLQVHQQNQSETASSPLKRDRSTTPLAEVVEQLADTTESAHKRQKPTTSEDKFEQADLLNSGGAISPATPLPPRLTKTTALGDGETAKAIPAPESSPFLAPLPPSTALAHRTPLPKTPLNVSELKTGKHEIAGIIRSKILFSKRPEPVVKLDDQSEED